jgi:hypothetical protein
VTTAGTAVDDNAVFVFGTYKMNERDELELAGDVPCVTFPLRRCDGPKSKFANAGIDLQLAPLIRSRKQAIPTLTPEFVIRREKLESVP